MNRTIALIIGSFLLLVLVGGGYYAYRVFDFCRSAIHRSALLTTPPEHGTKFLCELEPVPARRDDVDPIDSYRLGGNTNSAPPESDNSMADFREALGKRFVAADLRMHFEQVSSNRVHITVPISEPSRVDQVADMLTRPGRLEFRFAHDDSEKALTDNLVPPGYEVLSQTSGSSRSQKMVVKKRPVPGLTGNVIKEASVYRDNSGLPAVAFKLQPDATLIFADVTRTNTGRFLAVIVDGNLITAPRINSPILEGNGVIEGNYTTLEAWRLANALQAPLPTKVTVLEAKSF